MIWLRKRKKSFSFSEWSVFIFTRLLRISWIWYLRLSLSGFQSHDFVTSHALNSKNPLHVSYNMLQCTCDSTTNRRMLSTSFPDLHLEHLWHLAIWWNSEKLLQFLSNKLFFFYHTLYIKRHIIRAVPSCPVSSPANSHLGGLVLDSCLWASFLLKFKC